MVPGAPPPGPLTMAVSRLSVRTVDDSSDESRVVPVPVNCPNVAASVKVRIVCAAARSKVASTKVGTVTGPKKRLPESRVVDTGTGPRQVPNPEPLGEREPHIPGRREPRGE